MLTMDFKKIINRINPFHGTNSVVKVSDARRPENIVQKVRRYVKGTRPYDGDIRYKYGNFVVPRYPFPLYTLYSVAFNSDILTIIHNALKREIFRNGIEIIDATHADDETMTIQPGIEVTDEEIRQLTIKLENINDNDQTIIEVLKEIEDDFNIMDDGYLFFNLDYEYGPQGDIVNYKFMESLRVDPKYMGLVMNNQDIPGMDDEGNALTICPVHRDTLLTNQEICSCGKKTYRAFFRHYSHGEEIYYFKHEIAHKSRYRPSKRFGWSPVITTWQKTFTLYAMDDYVKELYEGKRPPKGLLVFNTSNTESLKKSWDDMLERAKENPHLPAMMAIENMGPNSPKKITEFTDFMKTLDELQYTEARNEMRRQIGAVYGVLPIWQGDVSQGGGLNNEGMQVTVTNRAIEEGQGTHNALLEKLIEIMQVEGIVVKLRPSEEQDEMAKLQRQNQSLINGQLAVQSGLQAEYDEDKGEVMIKDGDMKESTMGFDTETPDVPDSTGSGGTSGMSGSPVKPLGDVKSEVSKAQARPPFTNFSNILKNEINRFVKLFKRKPSESQLNKMIDRINANLKSALDSKTKSFFEKAYKKAADDVGRELGVNIEFKQVDTNAIKVLTTQKVLSDAYKGLSNDVTSQLKEIITESFKKPEGLTAAKITEKIKDAADVADFRAETIARVETSKVASAARRISYSKEDPEGEFLYKWIGPDDNRTTQTSKNIKKRVAEGVSWDNLIKIVTEESAKSFPSWSVNKDYPVSHYNSRHVFIKV